MLQDCTHLHSGTKSQSTLIQLSLLSDTACILEFLCTGFDLSWLLLHVQILLLMSPVTDKWFQPQLHYLLEFKAPFVNPIVHDLNYERDLLF